MKKIILSSLLLASLSLQAHAAQIWIRSSDSNAQDFSQFLNAKNRVSYVEFLQSEGQFQEPQNIDAGLELSSSKPLEALEEFQKSIYEIQNQFMTDQSRKLLMAVHLKITQMKLPPRTIEASKLQTEYLQRFTEVRDFPPRKDFFTREFELFQKLMFSRFGTDSLLLSNGKPIHQVLGILQPQMPQQWALISNTYSPILFWGTWSEFQVTINSKSEKVLAGGDCQNSDLSNLAFETRTRVQAFYSKDCQSSDKQASNLKMDHLPEAQSLYHSSETAEQSRKWIAPVALLSLGALVYLLKDKEVSFGFTF